MSSLSLRLPESLHEKVRELAARDDVSINQFIAIAVAEKAAAPLTTEYLAERGARGSRRAFDRILARVPAVVPAPGDELERGAVSLVAAKRRNRKPRGAMWKRSRE